MKGELYVCHVDTGRQFAADDQKTLAENIRFAENLGARVSKITGKTVAEAAAQFVRENHITQVIFGRSARTGFQRYLYMKAILKFLESAPNVDVHIVTQEPH
jgi:two-component system sensor histidine kinase KdpD